VPEISCKRCGGAFVAEVSRINRAAKTGAPLYCGLACAHAASRTVQKTMPCMFCGANFKSLSRADRAAGRGKFCSRACAAASLSAAANWRRPVKTCVACGVEKDSDHFRPRRLRCRSCDASAQSARTLANGSEADCEQCGTLFLARKGSGGFTRFCSRECINESQIKKIDRPCMNCGAAALRSQDAARVFCCLKCRTEYSVGSRNPCWKGGELPDGTLMVHVGRRKGYSSTLWAAHRVIASAAIGRTLKRSEVVIHIDNDKKNNKPENLYVCESIGEFRRRFLGVSMPWPDSSNLGQLKSLSNRRA
jgi:hypothetical protein